MRNCSASISAAFAARSGPGGVSVLACAAFCCSCWANESSFASRSASLRPGVVSRSLNSLPVWSEFCAIAVTFSM